MSTSKCCKEDGSLKDMYWPLPTSRERVTSSSGDEEFEEEETLLAILVKDPIRRFLDTVATSPISLVLETVLKESKTKHGGQK